MCVFGNNIKEMGSIKQKPHETHFQKYDLDNLVKAFALDSLEFPHFKNAKDSSYSQQSRKPTQMLARNYN